MKGPKDDPTPALSCGQVQRVAKIAMPFFEGKLKKRRGIKEISGSARESIRGKNGAGIIVIGSLRDLNIGK